MKKLTMMKEEDLQYIDVVVVYGYKHEQYLAFRQFDGYRSFMGEITDEQLSRLDVVVERD